MIICHNSQTIIFIILEYMYVIYNGTYILHFIVNYMPKILKNICVECMECLNKDTKKKKRTNLVHCG